ncbi:MAG: nucleotide exchange factor GrpE [Gammaproteobacteria bacterium]|nr:nucleotide exchange factor GrpE [Gammaproteobacteria bacterium]
MNPDPDHTGEAEDAREAAADSAETARDAAAEEGTAGGGELLSELKAKADENWDRYVRASAELENVRKRAVRDVENAHKFALERFAADLLAVCDSLEMALAAGSEAGVESYREGTEATLKLMGSVLQRYGIEEVDPQGEPFDPTQHEAMTLQPSAEAEPGSVLTVFQKGYALNGRLLRPARVVVAAEPAAQAEKG